MSVENAILVSNLDQNVLEKQLSDFFSFCGTISSLSLRRKEEGTEAVLFFQTEDAAKTALLLTNALIKDKPMVVKPYTEQKRQLHQREDETQVLVKKAPASSPETERASVSSNTALVVDSMPAEEITQRDPALRSATATLASILASGYILGVDAIEAAKKFDREKKISESLAQGSNTLAEKVNQIDSGLKISETASTTSRTVNEQWSHVDQAYHVSAGTASVGQAVSGWGASFVSGLSSAFQNPTVQTTLSSVSEWTNNVGRSLGTMIQPAADTVAREFNEIKVQSAREIELKRKEREEAEGGIILDNLDDLGGEAVFNVSAPSSSLSVPAEGLEEIPPPSDPSETEI